MFLSSETLVITLDNLCILIDAFLVYPPSLLFNGTEESFFRLGLPAKSENVNGWSVAFFSCYPAGDRMREPYLPGGFFLISALVYAGRSFIIGDFPFLSEYSVLKKLDLLLMKFPGMFALIF